MMLTALLFIPVTLWMTDFQQQPINWGFSVPGIAAVVQLLNAIGACTLVFALRQGKAIIVSPMCNALAPLITVMISLVLYGILPGMVTGSAIALAIVAVFLMVLDEERST